MVKPVCRRKSIGTKIGNESPGRKDCCSKTMALRPASPQPPVNRTTKKPVRLGHTGIGRLAWRACNGVNLAFGRPATQYWNRCTFDEARALAYVSKAEVSCRNIFPFFRHWALCGSIGALHSIMALNGRGANGWLSMPVPQTAA